MSEQRKKALREKLAKSRLRLRTLLMRLNGEQWNTEVYHDGEENWTVVQLVRHLTKAEQGLSINIKRIREGHGGVPEDFDLDRWNKAQVKKRADLGPKDLLAEMAKNRVRVLELIDQIEDDDWDKQGRAPTLEINTISEFLLTITNHEAQHTSDIATAVGIEIN